MMIAHAILMAYFLSVIVLSIGVIIITLRR